MNFKRTLTKALLIGALGALLVSCSLQPSTSPISGGTQASGGANQTSAPASALQTVFTLLNMPPILTGPGTGTVTNPPASAWYTVAQGTVTLLSGKTISGSRYTVVVPPGAVTKPTTIQVQEYDPNVLDFQLLPHGTQFVVPVTVSVSYRGTNADPDSPNYDGSTPQLVYFNPSTGLWELVVSVNDPVNKRLTAVLNHFSRYAVTRGTAEW